MLIHPKSVENSTNHQCLATTTSYNLSFSFQDWSDKNLRIYISHDTSISRIRATSEKMSSSN